MLITLTSGKTITLGGSEVITLRRGKSITIGEPGEEITLTLPARTMTLTLPKAVVALTTPSRTMTLTPTKPDQFAITKSFAFDAINDVIRVGILQSATAVSNLAAFSISMWVKRDRTGSIDILFSRQNQSFDFRGVTGFHFIDDFIFFDIISTLFLGVQELARVKSTNTVTDTNFHHYVWTYDGSSTAAGMLIYFDGVDVTDPVPPFDNITIPTTNLGNYQIGGRWDGTSFSLGGNIAEHSMWSIALSPAEVTELFNAGKPADLDLHSAVASRICWQSANIVNRFPIVPDRGTGGIESLAIGSTRELMIVDVAP